MTEKQGFTVKTRYVWFTMADWLAFSNALAEAYPQARYDIRPTHQVGPDRPEAIWDRRLMDIPLSREGYIGGDIIMDFDPNFQPEYETYHLKDDPPDIVRWGRETSTPFPFVKFQERVAPTADELATMTTLRESYIHYFCRTDDKPAAAHMRRFFRLFDKFCTNRNQAYYRLPSFELTHTEAKGSWYWFGHDAIRWVREHPRRTLTYAGSKSWAMRPCTEEEMAALAAQGPPARDS